MGILGIIVMLAVCWLLSDARKSVSIRVILWGVGLQFALAVLVLGIPAIGLPGILLPVFQLMDKAILSVVTYAKAGTGFVFGPLIDAEKTGFIMVTQVLAIIPFTAALAAVLLHWGVMQRVVAVIGWVMKKTMRISGVESLAAALNVFFGQSDTPLFIKPFLAKMTRSELVCLLVGGFATVAGSILVAYVAILQPLIPDIGVHLLTASIMSAPAAIVAAKVLSPETAVPLTAGQGGIAIEVSSRSTIDAIAKGAVDGLKIAAFVTAMLIAFIAVVAMVNSFLTTLGEWMGFAQWGASLLPEGAQPVLNLQNILGWLCAPIAWLIGITWSDAHLAGTLIGEKIVLNEFIAYLNLAEVKDSLDVRSATILSYALCGFANFGSIGIMIGAMNSLVPERSHDVANIGLRALLGGTVSALMTAAVVSILI
ncbi:MAG: hypothetical protein OYH77_01420 [Pseudomonadota bacterium]|nr:hypothetical protein [Pseudomonadota bacterium]